MAITDEVVADLTACVGTREHTRLGCVTDLMIARYAEAIGQLADPLYSDPGVARELGYPATPAPLNLLPSILVWSFGAEALELDDGRAALVPLTTVPSDGLLMMGGGEDMTFDAPVMAGTWVHEDSTLVDVSSRTGRSGLTAVLRYRNRFTDDDGTALMTCTRTLLVR